jgi:hypothetical protein
MNLRKLLFIPGLFLLLMTHAQSLNKKQLSQLQGIIVDFLDKDENANKDRPSEFMLCLLEIDSIGAVAQIHLLADEKNKDSAYGILSRLTPDVFHNWKVEKCKNKTIIIPIINIALGKSPKYIEAVKDLYAVRPYLISNIRIDSETNKAVKLTVLQWTAPDRKVHFSNKEKVANDELVKNPSKD